MAAILRHVRQAAHALAGRPWLTAVVVLTMALGIGANTAIYSVVDAVLLRPLPYKDGNRLLALVDRRGQSRRRMGVVSRLPRSTGPEPQPRVARRVVRLRDGAARADPGGAGALQPAVLQRRPAHAGDRRPPRPGPKAADVVRLVARQGALLAAAGGAIGLAGALLLGRLVQSLLFGVTPTDPGPLAVVAVVLTAVAGLACWIPARRAGRLDPVRALKNE